MVIGASIVIDFFRARLLYRVADATLSEALEADALHFGSDMWSSLAVLIGLVGVALGLKWADAVAAMAVAAFVCLAGWRLGRRTIDTLIDTAPEGAAAQLSAVARKVPGVVSVERVRARRVGKELFVELTAGVSRALPMDRVAVLKDEITHAIRQATPGVQVSITTEPRALDDETIAERVNVIARNRALAVHHVTVHAIDDDLAVSLDLEVDGELGLGAAHEIATGLEDAIRSELGPDVEVETHIEPMQADSLSGRDAPKERVKEVEGRTERAGQTHWNYSRIAQRARPRKQRGRDRQLPLPRRPDEQRAGGAREGRRARARVAPAFPLDQARDRSRGARGINGAHDPTSVIRHHH